MVANVFSDDDEFNADSNESGRDNFVNSGDFDVASVAAAVVVAVAAAVAVAIAAAVTALSGSS